MFEKPLSKQQRYSMHSMTTASSFSTALTETTSYRFSNVTDNESASEEVNTSMKKLKIEGGSAYGSMIVTNQEGFLNKSSTSEESLTSNCSTNM